MRSKTLVSWLVIWTSALAMNALLASCTVPAIAPVAPPWANAWATSATTAIKLIPINLCLESNMTPPCAPTEFAYGRMCPIKDGQQRMSDRHGCLLAREDASPTSEPDGLVSVGAMECTSPGRR